MMKQLALKRRGLLLCLALPFFLILSCGAPEKNRLKQNDEVSRRYFDMGIVNLRDGDTQRALVNFQKALAAEPGNPDIFNGLGLVYFARNELDSAVQNFKKALELDPALAEVHNNLGSALAVQGKKEEAIVHFQAALKSLNYPTPENVYYNMGLIYLDSRDYDQAAHHFNQAINYRATFAPAYLQLGRINAYLGNWKSAIAYYTQALRFNPTLSEAKLLLSGAYIQDGKRKLAREILLELIKEDPVSPWAIQASELLGSIPK